MEEVRYHSATYRQTACTTYASQETEDNEGSQVRGESTADLPDTEEDVSTSKYYPPTVDLTKRCKNQRSNNIATHVYADG